MIFTYAEQDYIGSFRTNFLYMARSSPRYIAKQNVRVKSIHNLAAPCTMYMYVQYINVVRHRKQRDIQT